MTSSLNGQLKTLDDFKKEFDVRNLSYRTSLLIVGELIYAARTVLSRHDESEFRVYMKEQRLSYEEQDIAVAAYLFEHPELPKRGVIPVNPILLDMLPPTKALKLRPSVQKKLLTRTLPVKTANGPVMKSFRDMSWRERSRLISNRGELLAPENQNGKAHKRMGIIEEVTMQSGKIIIRSLDSNLELVADSAQFQKALGPRAREQLQKWLRRRPATAGV